MVPIKNVHGEEAELNQFLRSVKVMQIQREFINQGESSYWGFAIEYYGSPYNSGQTEGQFEKGGKPKIDYRDVLSPEDFAVYLKIRDWRKTTSDKEGIPVYHILTNDQAAKISEKRVKTKAELKAIGGIGDGKMSKYSEAILQIVASCEPPKPARLG
jgi:superfamily II DNA helicase RecQ